MRSLVLIVALLSAGAGCPSRKPADTPPPPAPPAPALPPPPAPAAADANPAPARTELDRLPGVVALEEIKPELVGGAYVWPCPLSNLPDATLSIAKNQRLALSNGSRTLSVLKLDDDFYAPETTAICQKSFVSVRREKDGRYRQASFSWNGKRLAKTARAEGLIPPVRGP